MPCEKFVINNFGKAVVLTDEFGKAVGEENEKPLDALEFSNRKYLIDKDFFTTLKDYSQQNLQKTSIYRVVGWNKKCDKGLAAKITDSKELNEVVKEIEEYLIKL